MEKQDAAYWVSRLNLQPHPEGGFYKEVFRSELEVVRKSQNSIKQACTSIYYLLEGTDYSGFHRLASDEIWYFHKGEPLNIHVLDKQGVYAKQELSDTGEGSLSVVVPAGSWFAAEIPAASGFTLVSCAVAPGFDFTEFEMAKKEVLTAQYPQHASLFNKLCRE
jgi:predicted cupin superfamily sugar epimerase